MTHRRKVRLLGAALFVPFVLTIIHLTAHVNASPFATSADQHLRSAVAGYDWMARPDRRAMPQGAGLQAERALYLPLLLKGVERAQLLPLPTFEPSTLQPPTATEPASPTTPTTRVTATTTPASGTSTPRPTPGSPNPNQVDPVHLPALNFEGLDDVCRTDLAVMNVGNENTKVVLITWGFPGFCPPNCSGPLKVECSGLLQPGASWHFSGQLVPTGSKSGTLFSFTARQLTEIGADLGFDDVVADVLCETLFFGVVGECEDYARFKTAYTEGLDFAGIPLDRAYGAPLAVEIRRTCPGDVTPGIEVMSSYSGIAEREAGAYNAAENGYITYVPNMVADMAGFSSILNIQNAGTECASVEVWLKEQEDCLRARICEVVTVAPGESFSFDSTDCVGPGWQGSAWLRANQPVAVVADTIGRDTLATTRGLPELQRATDSYDVISAGSSTLYAPLTYSEYAGWETAVHVQNISTTADAHVKVFFQDRSGDTVTTLVGTVCLRGSRTFVLPVVAAMGDLGVGSVRVESLPWRAAESDPETPPQPIVGTATLTRYADAAQHETRERVAYELLTAEEATGWQGIRESWNLDHGVGRIAIPNLAKQVGPENTSSKLAIANLVTKPGFTDFAVLLYDRNGLVDYVCQKLNEKQVEYIDLQTWGYVNPGFKGSAIISATLWEHEVYGPSGEYLHNLVGLGAVAVQRVEGVGGDAPGDEAAAILGIPIPRPFVVSARVECPILLPSNPPRPSCSGDHVVVACAECPFWTEDLGTAASRLTVRVPDGCVVGDVDVRLAIRHEAIEDLDVTLKPPGSSEVELFSDVCAGASGDIDVILDDAATAPIGRAEDCGRAMAQFRRYNIEAPSVTPNLTSLEGQNPNGEWVLSITDDAAQNRGTVFDWELDIQLDDR